MNTNEHYLLLTPGPLTTSKKVKESMLKDWCTWDDDYNLLVQDMRIRLIALATRNISEYTSVLMQGSGTFSVESVIGTAIPASGKLLVLSNGSYGLRMAEIARCLKIDHVVLDFTELKQPNISEIEKILNSDSAITHVAVVHCETTTGILNPIDAIGRIVKEYGKIYIVDAMSSFGGIPFDVAELGIDYLISSANKCIQGVPGFGFIVARRSIIEQTRGQARSLSLDLYDQWQTMELQNGKWRFTSATHTVRAFVQALDELNAEGGVESRFLRYAQSHRTLVHGMRDLGFRTLLPDELHSPIITTFISPDETWFDFGSFYKALKAKGFVIYPGKVTNFNCFRIGNIGEVYPKDMELLLANIRLTVNELKAH